MNEEIKRTIISRIEHIDDIKQEEKSFTVTECRAHLSAPVIFLTMQTEDGQTIREALSIKEPYRLIHILKACGVYRADMTAREVLQDLPGKSGRGIFTTYPDGQSCYKVTEESDE